MRRCSRPYLRNKVWRTSWPTLFPARPLGWWQRSREGMRTPLHRFNNDMVFVDGELLRDQAGGVVTGTLRLAGAARLAILAERPQLELPPLLAGGLVLVGLAPGVDDVARLPRLA